MKKLTVEYYCIHHLPAFERKNYLTPFFSTLESSVNWIEDFLPDHESILNHHKVQSIHSANGSFLNKAELSCFMKHRLAVKKISESNCDYGVIFEDDIEYPSFDWNYYVNIFADQMSKLNGDILFIGSFTGHDIKSDSPNINVFHHKNFKSRCAHCYMLSPKVAFKLNQKLENIIQPYDWQINFTIDDLNLNACWSYPHINQRTEKGQIKSLLR